MTTPKTIHVQLPSPTFQQFDNWLRTNRWIRLPGGGYIQVGTEERKSITELEKMFSNGSK